MTKRQMAFGVTCFLVGILVGMEIAGNLDVLVRIVIVPGVWKRVEADAGCRAEGTPSRLA